jgi:methylenetetrahydrofolate dehydrogenase (NADP+)/methenyltetrahydrofolate cyclohydrolase
LAGELGLNFLLKKYSEEISEKKLIDDLVKTQKQRDVIGCIVQLPLPKNFDQKKVLSNLSPATDIDCLTDENLGRLIKQDVLVEPPTAGAIMEILADLKIDLKGKMVVLVGAGLLVGRPVSMLLLPRGATVMICNSKTKDLKAKTKQADIVITGVGKKNLVDYKMIKRGAVVIDAGFIYENGKVFGDVAWEKIHKKGGTVTPTPGGVGPITVAKLFHNAVICGKEKVK